MDLDRLTAWAFDLSGPWQKSMWSALAILAGWLIGAFVAWVVKRAVLRIGSVVRKRHADSEPDRADTMVLDLSASAIRILFVLGGIAIAADLFDVYRITDAGRLAEDALKAVGIFLGIWLLGAALASRVRAFGGDDAAPAAAGERTLLAFLSSLVRFAAIAVGIVAALQQFGFSTNSLVAVLGAAGLAIALALQDTLKAVAAGVVIAMFRPYRLGDYVTIADQSGTVFDITPFTTVLTTIDNRRVVVTNDKAWGNVIENYTQSDLRRLNVIVGVAYENDIEEAISIIERLLRSDPRVRQDQPVWVNVTALAPVAVEVTFRAWCRNEDLFDLQCDMLKGVKLAFDQAGILIPHPQLAPAPVKASPA